MNPAERAHGETNDKAIASRAGIPLEPAASLESPGKDIPGITSLPLDLLKHFRNSRMPLRLLDTRRSFAISRERTALILSRIRTVALFLSVLTFAWTIVDYFEFEPRFWRYIAIERYVAGAAFLWLARHRFGENLGRPELVALAALFAIPLCFLLGAELTFQYVGIAGPSITGAIAYYYLPFIMAAGLAIFPLTAVESAAIAISIVGTMAILVSVWPAMLGPSSALATLWRLSAIAGICSFAGNCQLRLLISVTEQASRDGLTGALTRQAGEAFLGMEMARAARQNTSLAIVFIDLDRFKMVNDRFGHDVGDAVLRRAVEQIQTGLRRQDALIRWGGEEFSLVLGQTTAREAEIVIERLGAIGLGNLPDGTMQTASIGLAERIMDGRFELSSLLGLADERMYAAKQAGRNRWINCTGDQKVFCKLEGRMTGTSDQASFASVDR